MPSREEPVTFHVTVNEMWTGQGTAEVVIETARLAQPVQHDEIRQRLRDLSRKFAPDAWADFERSANEQLAGPLYFEDHLLECRYSFDVGPDEVLQKHQRKTWEDQVQADADHALVQRRLNHLERWVGFLRQMDNDPLAPLAVQLASNPAQLADIITRRTSDRERLEKELKKICSETSDAYREMGVFDFVMQTDSALGTLIRYLGIDQRETAAAAEDTDHTSQVNANGDGPPH